MSLRRSGPRRSVRLVAGLAVLAAMSSLAACSSVESTAIRVNGQELSGSDFDELLVGYAAAIPTAESESGVVNGAVARGLLTDWASTVILNDALAASGVEVTPADLDEARSVLEGQSGFADASEVAQDFYVRATAVQRVFADAFGASIEELRDTYEGGPSASGVFCLRAILVTDELAISAIGLELAGGADFADVAAQYSIDSSAAEGGVISDPSSGTACFDQATLASQIVPEFAVALAEAEIGVPSDPFEIPGVGWVIALLRPFDEVAEDVRQIIGAGAADERRVDAIESAEVWVSSEYGVWESATGRIVPS